MALTDYAKARRLIARRDPVMRDLMRLHGPCKLAERQHTDPFRALIRAIVGQQLSTAAAATIFGRFESLFPAFPAPADVRGMPDERLRGVGLSGQKVRYLRDLCRCIEEGALRIDTLGRMDDEAVVTALTQVKGVGRWTAEMFLIFRLQRPDVLPVGDLGIVKAVQRAYKLRKMPTPDRVTRIGNAWRPYRSVACWYLWASLDNVQVKD
jgi:DNA-3-methyladenine glycosylase II